MATTQRHPDEILAVLDQAQRDLGAEFALYDLRSLLWEVMEDVVDSFRLAMSTEDDPDAGSPTFVERDLRDRIIITVEDYLVNHYGDD